MDSEISYLISKFRFYNQLPEIARQIILDHVEKQIINIDDVLFYQGSNSDYVYMLSSGQLVCYINTFDQKVKNVSTINPGELIGELSALTGEPRALTIKAKTNSIVLKIPSPLFARICKENPSIYHEFINLIINRSQHSIKILSGKKKINCITIFTNDEQSSFNHFKNLLIKNFDRRYRVKCFEQKDLFSENTYQDENNFDEKYDIFIIFLDFFNETFFHNNAMVGTSHFYLLIEDNNKEYVLPERVRANETICLLR